LGQNGRFKGRQFTAEVILWAVRWYLMIPVSYRDLALMLGDRGVEVDHSTIFRWIQAYAPELEKRIRPICAGATAPGGPMKPTFG
jgi:transposase, IS6 family